MADNHKPPIFIRARFLGTFAISINDRLLEGLVSQKTKALLAYLIHEGRKSIPRLFLASTFWPDVPEQTALHNLRQTLVSIRKSIESILPGEDLFLGNRDDIVLRSDVVLAEDASEFSTQMEDLLHQGSLPERGFKIHQLLRVFKLYGGEFLSPISLIDSDLFEDWRTLNRERLNQQAIKAASWLLLYHEKRAEWNLASNMAEKLIRMAPWDDDLRCRHIGCLLMLSQRSAALAAYQSALKYFQEQMGIETGSQLELAKKAIDGFQEQGRTKIEGFNLRKQLPHHSLPFIGRTRELEDLEARISDPQCNVVTIIGPSGVGKTRLAACLADSQESLFRDGVFYISIEKCISAEQIASKVFSALGSASEKGTNALEQLSEWAAKRKVLLILDNVESCHDAAVFAATIIENAPQLVMVYTSYSRLDLIGERVLSLEGLSREVFQDTEEYSEAVGLFLSLLKLENQRSPLSADELTQIRAICTLVEGVPLAIALAAGQSRFMSLEQLHVELRQGMDVLNTNAINQLERHRSIQASFENVWDHLSAPVRRSLSLLTMFKSPFTAEAAQAVFGIETSELIDLSGKSLLTWDGEENYYFHRIIRQYISEKNKLTRDEEATYANRHAEWFFDQVAAPFESPDLAQLSGFLNLVEGKLDDVIISISWWINTSNWHKARVICYTLYRYFDCRGKFREGARVFIELAELSSEQEGGQELTAMFSSRAAQFSLRFQEFKSADELLSVAYAKAQQNEWHEEIAFCLNVYSSQAVAIKNASLAEQYASKALELSRMWDLEEEEAHSLYNLGAGVSKRGEYLKAEQLFSACQQLCLQRKNWIRLLRSLNQLADTYCSLGDLDKGLDLSFQALEIAQAIGNNFSIAMIINNIGAIYMEQKALKPAHEYLLKSLGVCQEIHDREGESIALANIAEIALWEGDLQTSFNKSLQALAIGEEIESDSAAMSALIVLSETYRKMGEHEKAHQELLRLLNLSLDGECSSFFYRAVVEGCHQLKALGKIKGLKGILEHVILTEGAEEPQKEQAREFIASLPDVDSAELFASEEEVYQHMKKYLH